MKILLLPFEIIPIIFLDLSIKDLTRLERVCKCIQFLSLIEIQRRIKTNSLQEDWNILVNLNYNSFFFLYESQSLFIVLNI